MEAGEDRDRYQGEACADRVGTGRSLAYDRVPSDRKQRTAEPRDDEGHIEVVKATMAATRPGRTHMFGIRAYRCPASVIRPIVLA